MSEKTLLDREYSFEEFVDIERHVTEAIENLHSDQCVKVVITEVLSQEALKEKGRKAIRFFFHNLNEDGVPASGTGWKDTGHLWYYEHIRHPGIIINTVPFHFILAQTPEGREIDIWVFNKGAKP